MVETIDVRQELNMFKEAELSDGTINHYITKVASELGTSNTDDTARMLLVCYRIAMSFSWNSVNRVGDVTFETKNPEYFKKRYVARCSSLSVDPIGLEDARPRMRKINWNKVDTQQYT